MRHVSRRVDVDDVAMWNLVVGPGSFVALLLIVLLFAVALYFYMAVRLGQLSDRKRKLDEEIASLRPLLKKARNAAAWQARARSRVWVIAGRRRIVTLTLYVMTQAETAATLKYMQRLGRQNCWPDKSDAELLGLLRDLLQATDEAELESLDDEARAPDLEAMTSAVKFLQRWSVSVWVAMQNRRNGVAPSSAAVLDKFEAHRAALPIEIRPPPLGSAFSSSARKELTRWRRCWGGRLGSIPTSDEPPLQDMRDKACVEVHGMLNCEWRLFKCCLHC